jgi:hypothetical protein
MNNLTEQLVKVLEKELETHLLLIAAARDMNDAVKAGIIENIQSAARRYDCCITDIAGMEEKRLELSDQICGCAPQNGASVTLNHASLLRVIDTVPFEWKNIITGLRTKLRAEINDLSKINYANEVLLTESLSAIQKTFEMIATKWGAPGSGYLKQGKKASPRSTTTIVNKIA